MLGDVPGIGEIRRESSQVGQRYLRGNEKGTGFVAMSPFRFRVQKVYSLDCW